MKWVRCLSSITVATMMPHQYDSGYKNITLGKNYQVVEIGPGIIKIINDVDEVRGVFTADFEDVTAEVIANERDNKLKELGLDD